MTEDMQAVRVANDCWLESSVCKIIKYNTQLDTCTKKLHELCAVLHQHKDRFLPTTVSVSIPINVICRMGWASKNVPTP